MKHILPLLLCLVLLLGGCSQTLPQNEDVQSTTGAADEKLSLLPKPFDFSKRPGGTDPSTQGSQGTPSVNVKVSTDYSHYTAYAPTEAPLPVERLREDWISELEASENYGRIYPFAGNTLYSSLEEDRYFNGFLYGMIDETGRVIADATYSEIELLTESLSYDLEEASVQKKVLPMWVLSRTFLVEESTGETICALASLDGSFVTECKYSYVSGSSDGYVLAAEELPDGSHRFDLFDMEGKLVCRSEDFACMQKSDVFLRWPEYSEGMLLFRDRQNDIKTDFYFTNLSGDQLLGPFSSARSFSEGYALVSYSEDSDFFFIDKHGNALNNMYFSYAEDFYDGVALCHPTDRTGTVLLNNKGKILLERPTEWDIYRTAYGLHDYSNNKYNTYDTQGKPIYEEDIPVDWIELGNGYFAMDTQIIHYRTEASFDFSQSHPDGYVRSGYPYGLPYFAIVSWSYENRINHCCLLNDDLQVIEERLELGTNGYLDFQRDLLTGKSYLWINTKDCSLLYGADSSAPLRVEKRGVERIRIYGGRILFLGQDHCAYYDLDGNLLFCYSTTGLSDD